jgi:hypothetical protein
MQNNNNTPAPGSDLEDTEIGGDQGENKSDGKKPHGSSAAQNPDKV